MAGTSMATGAWALATLTVTLTIKSQVPFGIMFMVTRMLLLIVGMGPPPGPGSLGPWHTRAAPGPGFGAAMHVAAPTSTESMGARRHAGIMS